MTSKTTVTTFVTGAIGFIGTAFVSVFHRAGASRRSTAGNDSQMQRFGSTLLLAVPLLLALVPEAVDSTRTLDVTVTRYAGTFEISCSKYCGRGHGRMKASLIVTPRT